MDSLNQLRVAQKNDLSTYLGNWKNAMNMLSDSIFRRTSEAEGERYHIVNNPKPFISFSFNSYDLSIMLIHLDDKLRILEATSITPSQFPYQAYAEAKVFLKICYILIKVLLDDIAGIIEYFYKKNEPNVHVRQRLNYILKDANNSNISDKNLEALIKELNAWFPEIRRRRDDLVHHYETLLVSFKQNQNGANTIGQFSTGKIPTIEYEDIRNYFGFILCEYQKFIDHLLDHFDTKFDEWYGISQGKGSRTLSITMGNAGVMLWWAYKFGNYRDDNLKVTENENEANNDRDSLLV